VGEFARSCIRSNRSRDLQDTGGRGSNINLVPVERYWVNRIEHCNAMRSVPSRAIKISTSRPISCIRTITACRYVARKEGRFTIQTNYSYSKALGLLARTRPTADLRRSILLTCATIMRCSRVTGGTSSMRVLNRPGTATARQQDRGGRLSTGGHFRSNPMAERRESHV